MREKKQATVKTEKPQQINITVRNKVKNFTDNFLGLLIIKGQEKNWMNHARDRQQICSDDENIKLKLPLLSCS